MIVDDCLLLAVKPAGQGDYQEMERLYSRCHCANRLSVILLDNNIIRLVRIFVPYGAVAWTALWGLGVYLLGQDIQAVFAVFHRLEPYLIVVSLLAVIVLVLYLRRGRKSADTG